MSKKKLLFELHGFEVMSDSIYMVVDKRDYNAPTGFQERGVTKLPSDGVGNTFRCPYRRLTATSGTWDTGLYELSPCYEGIPATKVEQIVKSLESNVVKPYQRAIGDDKALHQHNNEFFDKTRWNVHEGKIYKTRNPIDVVSLYFALLSRELVPKAKKDDSTFNDTAYIIIDVNENIRKKDEVASQMFEAIGVFEVLYKMDKNKLDKILYYLGKNIAEDTEIGGYRSLFKSFLESSVANIEAFMKTVKDSESEKGEARLNIYHALKSNNRKNPKLTISNGIIYYEGTEVGIDLKAAAENITINPGLSDIKREILFGDLEDLK